MAPFLSGRYVLQYIRRRLVNHLNAGEIRQAPDLLGQGAVCPLYNLLKAFEICGAGHEANFTTRTSGETWAPDRFCWKSERSQGDNCCKIAIAPWWSKSCLCKPSACMKVRNSSARPDQKRCPDTILLA